MANRIACIVLLATTVSATAAQPFDGSWLVNVATQVGNCGTYSSELLISEGRIATPPGTLVSGSGTVSRSGRVRSALLRWFVFNQCVGPSKEISCARTLAGPHVIMLRHLASGPSGSSPSRAIINGVRAGAASRLRGGIGSELLRMMRVQNSPVSERCDQKLLGVLESRRNAQKPFRGGS